MTKQATAWIDRTGTSTVDLVDSEDLVTDLGIALTTELGVSITLGTVRVTPKQPSAWELGTSPFYAILDNFSAALLDENEEEIVIEGAAERTPSFWYPKIGEGDVSLTDNPVLMNESSVDLTDEDSEDLLVDDVAVSPKTQTVWAD